jgi:hypothetical protein
MEVGRSSAGSLQYQELVSKEQVLGDQSPSAAVLEEIWPTGEAGAGGKAMISFTVRQNGPHLTGRQGSLQTPRLRIRHLQAMMGESSNPVVRRAFTASRTRLLRNRDCRLID